MSFSPSATAIAIATAAGNNIATLAAGAMSGLQTLIAGGSLTCAAFFDALRTSVSFTAVTGGVGYQNGWVDFTSGAGAVSFYKDAFGFVHLRGSMKSGTLNVVAFTLPLGYRPQAFCAFTTFAFTGAAPTTGFVGIDTAGNLTPQFGSNNQFYLDGISFFAG